jgi:hypothetical protein
LLFDILLPFLDNMIAFSNKGDFLVIFLAH